MKPNVEAQLNIIQGKALVGKATAEDMMFVFGILFDMEVLLDEADFSDFFGTEGWRHRLGWED